MPFSLLGLFNSLLRPRSSTLFFLPSFLQRGVLLLERSLFLSRLTPISSVSPPLKFLTRLLFFLPHQLILVTPLLIHYLFLILDATIFPIFIERTHGSVYSIYARCSNQLALLGLIKSSVSCICKSRPMVDFSRTSTTCCYYGSLAPVLVCLEVGAGCDQSVCVCALSSGYDSSCRQRASPARPAAAAAACGLKTLVVCCVCVCGLPGAVSSGIHTGCVCCLVVRCINGISVCRHPRLHTAVQCTDGNSRAQFFSLWDHLHVSYLAHTLKQGRFHFLNTF